LRIKEQITRLILNEYENDDNDDDDDDDDDDNNIITIYITFSYARKNMKIFG
jgi:hypothetical protein